MGSRSVESLGGRLRRSVEASASVRIGRAVIRGSAIYRAVQACAGEVRSSYLWRRLHPATPPRDFRRATEALVGSGLVERVDGWCGRAHRAWELSATRAALIEPARRLEPWQRLRLAGWAVLVATLVRVTMRPPGWPPDPLLVSGLMVPAVVGVVLMFGARSLAEAWRLKQITRSGIAKEES